MKKTEAMRRGWVRSIVWTVALFVLAPLFAQEAEYSDGGRVLRRCPRDVTSFTIPSTVQEIGDHAFAGCSMLASVVIPDSVREIEDEAFRGCISLASIAIPASVHEIEDDAFLGCSSLDSIEVDSGNRRYCSIDGALYSKNKKVLYCCPGKRTSFVIPSSVTIIGDSAFSGCESLASVTIPDSVREIEDEAFRDCVSLKEITIPDSVREIEDEAFRDCNSLVSVVIPDSVREIGDRTFMVCDSLESITIPASVREIGDNAFSDCPKLTVTAKSGSAAWKYAELYNIPVKEM